MPATEAQKRASQKWQKDKVDDLRIRVEKGQREIIRNHAKTQGESLNAFVNRAIMETMERDKQERDI